MKRAKKKAGHRSWAAKNGRVAGTHVGDIMAPATRSRLMSRIKGKDTGPERLLAEALRASGVRFHQYATDLPGRPDFVFRKLRVVVFVDGDFWHGWRFSLWRHKLSEKWRVKIEGNRKRDTRNFRWLRRNGWKVIRVWEHQIEQSLEKAVARVIQALSAASITSSEI